MKGKLCPFSSVIDCDERCALYIKPGEAEQDGDGESFPKVGGCAIKINALAMLKVGG